MSDSRVWVLYDSRAADGDTSSASVVETAESRKAAQSAAWWRMKKGETVCTYSYREVDGALTDERGPYRFGPHLGKGPRR